METRLIKAHPWIATAIAAAILAASCGACFLQLTRQSAQQSSGGEATSKVSP